MTPNLLIVESDPVVAMDLSQTVADVFPRGVVHVFSSLAEAETALASMALPLVSLVSVETDALQDIAILTLLERLAQNVVLIVDNALAGDPALGQFVVLPRPFSSGMVADALVSLSGARS